MRLSAFVITCDRPMLLAACLKRLQWVDELIVVDKGRQHPPPAMTLALRAKVTHYQQTEWTPVVEDTRAFAQSLCTGDWIMCLDDDEILSYNAEDAILASIGRPTGIEAYLIPLRDWICGKPSEHARPTQWRTALYRRDAVRYSATVHAGTELRCRQDQVAVRGDVWIDHLSHANIASWIEKTNRYTDQRNRSGAEWRLGMSVAEEAKRRFAAVLPYPDNHAETISVLLALYDIVDLLKRWEETRPNGNEVFTEFCREVMREK